jgi:hypothetical protein
LRDFVLRQHPSKSLGELEVAIETDCTFATSGGRPSQKIGAGKQSVAARSAYMAPMPGANWRRSAVTTDWLDPESRLALIEELGPLKYSELFTEHMRRSTVAVENGHRIRPVLSRFGTLYAVGEPDRTFATLEQARAFARSLSFMPEVQP